MRGLDIFSDSSFADRKRRYTIAGVVVLVVLVVIAPFVHTAYAYLRIAATSTKSSLCPLYEVKRPDSFVRDNSSVLEIVGDKRFRLQSVQKLSGAIQVDTVVFDNQPDVAKNPKVWAKFAKFHDYLKLTFPTVFEQLEVEYVNTYGIVLYWKGSNKLLKPLMLTAHQDVVPVQRDTLQDWTYPPFEGHFDGEFVYGRGAADCKNTLIAILESFELLLAQKYKPQRGLIAAFGFDEEASGIHGASTLGQYLEAKFGVNSIYAIVDEGPGLLKDPYSNLVIAMPATGEKGYLDVLAELKTPGGHSSVPPDHTLVGIIGELAYLIERDPYESVLPQENPYLGFMQCLAVHSPKNKKGLPSFLRKSILRAGHDKLANSKVIEALRTNLMTKYLITTSQANDIVKGGEKANALPEFSQLITNHRVAIGSSLSEVKLHYGARVKVLAEKHGLGLELFGEEIITPTPKGQFVISEFSKPLNPAPVTPLDDNVWEYLAGATRHVFEDVVFRGDSKLELPIVMAPGIMTGNTDTRYYWNLTKNIFRYSPMFLLDMIKDSNVHSVDEKLRFDSHLHLLAFFYEYIQIVDSA